MTTVFVDGNNVMGSRPDGSWRNRAEAAQRLVDKIAPVARRHAGAWAIVFAGPGPTEVAAPLECHSVLHNGHGRRDGADDRIVELVGALPDRATTLVYTSAAALRARVHALGARVAGARALLEEIAAAYSSAGPVRTQHLGSLDWQFQSIHRMLAGRTGCRGRFTRDRARRLERVRCLFPREVIAHRRAAPPDDILSALVQVEEEGDVLTGREMLNILRLLLVIGNETATNLVGTGNDRRGPLLAERPNPNSLLIRSDPGAGPVRHGSSTLGR